MEFEQNNEDLKHEDAQVDLNGGLVDAHFSLEDLFVGDYASSISSASPPHEWPQPQTWNNNNGMQRQVQTGEIDPVLFNPPMANGVNPSFDDTIFDFQGLHAMNNMNNMIIDMSSNIFSQDMPITLPPSELHKSPQEYQFIPPAMMTMAQSNNAPQSQDNDIAAVVKRLTGITNAQIAGTPTHFAPNLHDHYGIPAGFSDNSYSSASSDRSSVPPQTMEPTQPLTPASEAPVEGSIPTSTARPKTAHTTIERRYRTNLNTCIVGLRNSIPAVRYLDKSYKNPSGVQDKPDERGFVDGVKAARKISKATIMSKAREYITVLKRRETRLQSEVTAMKDLLSSLVNGPVLLQAFEAEWATRQAAEAADDEMDSGDMDSEDDGDDESADERPRKKAKIAPSTPVAPVKPKKAPRTIAAASGTSVVAAEETRPKKRGRPPKNATAGPSPSSVSSQVHFTTPISSTPPSTQIAPQSTQTQFSFIPVVPQQQKPVYLLASFIFLSFFKPSPRETIIVPSDEGTNHSHLGRVLSSHENPFGSSAATVFDSPWYTHPVLHIFHTALMIALFVALAVSLSPQNLRNKVWRYLSSFSISSSAVQEKWDEKDAMDSMSPLARAETELKSSSSTTKSKVKAFTVLQAATPSPSTEQLGLMALLRFPSKASQAGELWKEAMLSCDSGNPVKSAFEVPLESACTILQQSSSTCEPRSPLVIIASKSVESQLEETLKDAFVNDVIAVCEPSTLSSRGLLAASESTKRTRDDLAKRAVALGGRPAELVKEWDHAFSGRVSKSTTELEQVGGKLTDDTGVVLLRVLALMRRIFPAASRPSLASPGGLPSPPPSPLPREELVKMERVLRVTLDAKAFHGASPRTDGAGADVKEKERCEEVQRARDMLISRLSQAARMRRLVALEGQDQD